MWEIWNIAQRIRLSVQNDSTAKKLRPKDRSSANKKEEDSTDVSNDGRGDRNGENLSPNTVLVSNLQVTITDLVLRSTQDQQESQDQ